MFVLTCARRTFKTGDAVPALSPLLKQARTFCERGDNDRNGATSMKKVLRKLTQVGLTNLSAVAAIIAIAGVPLAAQEYRAPRGLDRSLFQRLIAGDWITAPQNLIVEGPTGVGKSWLACALGNKACRDNHSVLYQRVPKLFPDLALARGDGRYTRLMKRLGKVSLLILDDWGLEPFGPDQRRDLLEIVEERCGRGATLITSQIPVDRWHDIIGEPTIADAILDRIVHNAHRLKLKGDSLRRKLAAPAQPA